MKKTSLTYVKELAHLKRYVIFVINFYDLYDVITTDHIKSGLTQKTCLKLINFIGDFISSQEVYNI
jgi:hypothetical protein